MIVTKDDNALSNHNIFLDEVAPCPEEADTQGFGHAKHATMQGYKALIIKANDICVLHFCLGLVKMWIGFGQGGGGCYGGYRLMS